MERILQILDKAQLETLNVLSTNTILQIQEEIESLFLMVKKEETLESANYHFDVLEKAQFILSKFLFIKNMDLSTGLKKFVRDFDRIDDNETRKYLFQKIKAGEYSLS